MTPTPDSVGGRALPGLGDTLEFLRLIRAIDHGLESESKRLARSDGVTELQRLVLHVVGRFPGISAGQLAATLHTHPSTLTGVLRRLEHRRLLSRRADPRDRRRAFLGLTPAGLRLAQVVTGATEPALQRLLEDLPPQRVRIAREVLAALAVRLGVDGVRP